MLLDMMDPFRMTPRPATGSVGVVTGPGNVSIDLPGVGRDGLKVARTGRRVVVDATRSWPDGREGRTTRTLLLPEGSGPLRAELRDGVLTLSFDASPEEVPVEVPVG